MSNKQDAIEHNEQGIVHKPVLMQEVLKYLNIGPKKTFVDVTFGSGGHTRAILEQCKDCRVIALDWDQKSFDTFVPPFEEEFGDRFIPVWGNFALLYKIFKENNFGKVDGILADFGTSQMQIFERSGFSVYQDTPLDMRMSPSFSRITAAHVVNKEPMEKLQQIFSELGGERFARQIAQRIVQERAKYSFRTTGQLARLVEQVVGAKGRQRIHPATRVFQALRIFINRELDNIKAFLPAALSVLKPSGTLVCISFHSLEDRIVKEFFKEQHMTGRIKILTPKVVMATQQERAANPSARSARLRAAQLVDSI